ncbi:MAG: GvpL/GvpF family gas vesicle protein [Candidatus Rokuibacteriota bacterium]
MQAQRYLYAIVDSLPSRWRPSPNGVGGGVVTAHGVRDLVLVASPVGLPPARNPRAEACHHDILAGLLDAGAVVPFPFGTVVGDSELASWLEARWSRICSAVDHLRGRIEMNVRLLRLDSRAPANEGAAALLRGVAERLVERAGLAAWRYAPTGHGANVAASVAFLVPREEVPAFLARIAPVAARVPDVAVVPTGPWPAYSFAPPLEEPAPTMAASA